MTTTKHPYLKEILKTTAKVGLLAGAAVLATPYVFGFAAGLLNLLAAGYVAGGMVAGIGTWVTLKTLVKDMITLRPRVQQKLREERIDTRLGRLEQKMTRLMPPKEPPKDWQPVLPEPKKERPLQKRDLLKMRRMKDYQRAA